jgi:hypothetical protein
MDTSVLISLITSIGGTISVGGAAFWKWVSKQLDDCKEEHKQSRQRIEELHDEIKVVSVTVGELKGQLFAYKTHHSEVDTNHSST